MIEPAKSANEVLQTAPPILITSASFLGLAFHEWVYALTAIYTAIQIFRLIPKVLGCMRCYRDNDGCDRTCKMR